jgi:hypothetical protein
MPRLRGALFSTPLDVAEIPNTDFVFRVGTVPANVGKIIGPESFGVTKSRSSSGNNWVTENERWLRNR